jgi:phospho-N-acetylmuramoyl-pentapeptide-transferase
MKAILLGGGLALVFSLLGTRAAIPLFFRLGYGQPIRDDGPTSHHTKRGTPTMGGVVIIASAVLAYFLADLTTQNRPSASALLLIFLFVGMGLVGFLDDFIKVSKQRSLGLRSKAKMIGQTVIALVFGWLALSGTLEDDTSVPHWFGSTGDGPAEVLSIFGRPGERMHLLTAGDDETG